MDILKEGRKAKIYNLIRKIARLAKTFIVKFFYAVYYIFAAILALSGIAKFKVANRLYWGRGTFYKISLHIFIISFTLLVFLTGLSYKLPNVVESSNFFALSDPESGNIDSLEQGIGIKTIQTAVGNLNFEVNEHVVQDGDSVDSIAAKFGVSRETVKWANQSKIDHYKENLIIGTTLVIPEITGVLYNVVAGDTVDSVIAKTSGDRFEVIEINQLQAPDFNLAEGSRILIPNGTLPPPPPAIPYMAYNPITNIGVGISIDYSKLDGIGFTNPLSNPDCGGYGWSRGFLPWHNGIDISRGGGCPVRAAAAGQVSFAGWSYYGEGYNVRIYHGNGVETHYYHAESLWVNTGDFVAAGQEIMYMGCTGNCTGTHLHFTMKIDGTAVDPSPYVWF